MTEGILNKNAVIVEDSARDIYDSGWYGEMKDKKLELDFIEACYLLEREKLKIVDKNSKDVDFKKFFTLCSKDVEGFVSKYIAYSDLRERGLPVRLGYKDCDFKVYERGIKSGKRKGVKWIVFVNSEDYVCSFKLLEKSIKLSKNIRSEALWAVVDNDGDVTYYIINSPSV
jgi:tRNA-intron endonuclease